MARSTLGPAGLAVAQAVEAAVVRALAAPFPRGRSGRVQEQPPSLVVAVSGGADSLALALGTAWVVRATGPYADLRARAVVVDHGLQAGSAEVADRAAGQVRSLGLDADVARVTPDGRGGPEDSARRARYGALLAERSAYVLLGHTLDDQAETVLLGLARGSGTRSLAGMAERSGRLVRPLLGLRRTTTETACAEAGLEPWHDPHNDDPAYARSRLRAALPYLDDLLGPGLPEALARTATLARADADLLDRQAAELVAGDLRGEALDARQLASLPDAMRGRVLLSWLRSRGAGDVTMGHVASVDRLVTAWRGQAGVDVIGGTVARIDGRLTFAPVGGGDDPQASPLG